MSDTGLLLNIVFDEYFQTNIAAAKLISNDYARLWEELYRLFQSGGKRLRPKMTYITYAAYGGQDIDAIAPIAAAQELLHLSLLIHDDVIDRDYRRYGVLNITGSYKEHYDNLGLDDTTKTHYAQGAAILGGDLLISGAYQLIASSKISPELKEQVNTVLGRAIFEVAGGELLDTESAFRPKNEIDSLAIARYKTAGYSFIGPLLSGALLAGASKEQCDVVRDFATNLGIAYQLQDDILGVYGDENETGKSSISDIVEGKHTFLVDSFYALTSQEQVLEFNKYFGNKDASREQIDIVKQLIVISGALDLTQKKLNEYESFARENLDQMDISSDSKATFEDLITQSLKRQK